MIFDATILRTELVPIRKKTPAHEDKREEIDEERTIDLAHNSLLC